MNSGFVYPIIYVMKKSFGALNISAVYLTFGMLWIFFSDMLLEKLSPNIAVYTQFQTYKGWFYVFISTLLIYSLLRIYIAKKNTAISSLELKEKELKQELSEKDLLFKEVHHRVKNNLQILTSLIGFRIESDPLPVGRSTIRKIAEQIQSLSLIYESVYQEKNLSCISIASFIKDIAGYLHSNSPELGHITLEYDIEDEQLNIEKAVPFGIIISESLSNSFRHAFPDGADGFIKIKFYRYNSTNIFMLEDNGCGFAAVPDDSSLGFRLIRMLTQQLNGEVEIKSEPGTTRIELKFT